MSPHQEIAFEDDICHHLGAHGWRYDGPQDHQHYDRALALYPADLIAWVRESQPEAWESLEKRYGAAAAETLLTRVRTEIDARGTLDVLRNGVSILGVKKPIALAQFKPAFGVNPELQARYAANRLRVVRQLRYSVHHENSLDLGLFLNGVPVATAELKTDFTQSVEDAVDQYRFDRNPKPKGQAKAEPLLSFPNGALVHFAISNSLVRMTTRLAGAETIFLPFDLGDGGGAGNPVNPSGHRTAYLWERVWQRDSWLEILGRYLIAQRDTKKQIARILFPRYHQLDATRALVAAVLAEGVGGRYLIQHSAGSGKTNTIAWTAHFFADLHDASDQKVFDSVIVVSDRTVLDVQLQEAIFDFQRTTGVVAVITDTQGSKSSALAEALAAGKKIIVCTIQTFPFALAAVRELAATQDKRFAVIADEAHSSQSGEAAAKLKEILSPEELADLADGGEVSSEDVLAAQMAARASDSGITFVALTATPKAKTLELFGRRPDPSMPAGKDNLPEAFHVYSMRQAIEEGFILDVLRNYTPYSLAFKLATGGKELDARAVERAAAMQGLMRWVRLHPYNIAQKVQVVVEHYWSVVAPLLDGRAKAMVVLGSRVEAVRWQIAMTKYIAEKRYPLGVLVAFSGEVNDPESGPEPFTERGTALNPDLKGRDIRDAFATGDYQLLLVANKFQTGFDQPLLCGLYVDRRLAGVQAVQTLSRLNRAYPGKDTTYVLDFVNDPAEVLAAFKPYYETAALSDVTNPDLVFDLRAKLDAAGHYDDYEVARVVAVELDPKATQKQLSAAVEPVADRLIKQFAAARKARTAAKAKQDSTAEQAARDTLDALVLFKRDMGTYLRVYTFLSQIFDYGITDIEKRAIFFRRLLPLLNFGRERETVDLSSIRLTHHALRGKALRDLPLGIGEGDDPADYRLKPMSETGSGEVRDPEKVRLAEIIKAVNDLFEGVLTDDDKLVYVNEVLKTKLLESGILVQQALNNSKEQFAASPNLDDELTNAIIDALDAHTAMGQQALNSERVREGIKRVLLGPGQLWEALRVR
jgi:type I restriction enzyme R subunit